jgi:2-polyprenyl-3-methyl-5-hydroxy-6-metoxy-1,4-benzoquinol methylase
VNDNQFNHNAYQRQYFDTVERARLRIGETPYILDHVERLARIADLQPDQKILEIGAGTGKFTLPLLAKDYDIVGNDLSPNLLEQLVYAGGEQTLCCDVHDIARFTDQRFERVIGFFVLHHLIDFDSVFSALAKVTRPGGIIAFCEPVATNPLYYLQILFTPNMSFRGEPSITAMRPGIILPAMKRAGFVVTQTHRYGYFPPMLKNRAWGARLENWLDHRAWVPFPHAFQIFSARMPL